jgi:hypothetical protein
VDVSIQIYGIPNKNTLQPPPFAIFRNYFRLCFVTCGCLNAKPWPNRVVIIKKGVFFQGGVVIKANFSRQLSPFDTLSFG